MRRRGARNARMWVVKEVFERYLDFIEKREYW